MALIKCPECGKEVSDKAKICVHCGYPLKDKTKDDKLFGNHWSYGSIDFF